MTFENLFQQYRELEQLTQDQAIQVDDAFNALDEDNQAQMKANYDMLVAKYPTQQQNQPEEQPQVPAQPQGQPSLSSPEPEVNDHHASENAGLLNMIYRIISRGFSRERQM
jgi:hypothetical protein